MILPSLFIAEIHGKGRGVFTNETILANTVIEVAPVIVMQAADRLLLDKTFLHDYIFEWGNDNTECCMALGYVPIYNHSYESNCEYFMDYDDKTMLLKTVRDVNAEEEITINYNGDWNDNKKIWFEVE